MNTDNNTTNAINFSAMKAEYEHERETAEQADSTTRMLGTVILFVIACGFVSIIAAVVIALAK